METLKALLAGLRDLLFAWLGYQAASKVQADKAAEKAGEASQVRAQVDSLSDSDVHDELRKWER